MALSTNKALVAVVDGSEMVFCRQGEEWCAITEQRVNDRDSWHKRATQGSEENIRTMPFHRIMRNAALHVRVKGETKIRTVHQRQTDSIDADNVWQWRPYSRDVCDRKWCPAAGGGECSRQESTRGTDG